MEMYASAAVMVVTLWESGGVYVLLRVKKQLRPRVN